jgi:uncharacterized protein YdeI (YjbR/CyaY-like superfamily)
LILHGIIHKVPKDLKEAIESNKKVLDIWNTLTPIARNEWICWTISVKKQETREKHIKRVLGDLISGKRRPCCWAGCQHRI